MIEDRLGAYPDGPYVPLLAIVLPGAECGELVSCLGAK
jgi:hypothetical protein